MARNEFLKDSRLLVAVFMHLSQTIGRFDRVVRNIAARWSASADGSNFKTPGDFVTGRGAMVPQNNAQSSQTMAAGNDYLPQNADLAEMKVTKDLLMTRICTFTQQGTGKRWFCARVADAAVDVYKELLTVRFEGLTTQQQRLAAVLFHRLQSAEHLKSCSLDRLAVPMPMDLDPFAEGLHLSLKAASLQLGDVKRYGQQVLGHTRYYRDALKGLVKQVAHKQVTFTLEHDSNFVASAVSDR